MKKRNKKFLDNKGVTGIDLTISIIILSILSGLIVSLMSSIYKTSIEIQKSANAMAYATIVLEKVDAKSFNEVNDDFVNTLKNNGEVEIGSDYTINFATEEIEVNLLKKVIVNVLYDVNGEQKAIKISKLKIKEIYKEWKKYI